MPSIIPPRSRSIPHLPGLDGIRALAIVAVLLYHAELSWAGGGFLGVEVFFVLSGYLITSLLWRELRGTGGIELRRFYLRRARRLLPAVIGLLVLVMTAFAIGWAGEIGRIRGDVPAALAYVTNWYQVATDQGYFSELSRPSPFRHLWSLAIEEQFYLVWPALLAFVLGKRPARRMAFVTAALALVSAAMMWLTLSVADPSRGYLGTDTRAFGLLAGSMLAFVYRPFEGARPAKRLHLARRVLDGAFVAALGFLVFAFLNADEFAKSTFRPGIQLVSLASVVLIATTINVRTRASRWLAIRPMQWLGTRSYSIYLWHWPVFVVTRPGVDLDLGVGPTLALRLAITVPLAEASYRFIERPIRDGALTRAYTQIRARMRGSLTQRARAALPGTSAMVAVTTWMLLVAVIALAAPSPQPTDIEVALRSAALEEQFSTAPRERPGYDDRGPIRDVPPVKANVIAVGDSVMLGARSAIKKQIKGVWMSARVSRQPSDGVDTLRLIRSQNSLRRTVVVHLGDNGRFTSQQIDRMMSILLDVEHVIIVTVKVPRRWEATVNATLRDAAARYDNVTLVDWNRRWRRCPGGKVFARDGYHLSPNGARCYANLIAGAIASRLPVE